MKANKRVVHMKDEIMEIDDSANPYPAYLELECLPFTLIKPGKGRDKYYK